MGFNPALLLDPPPSGDNLVMRVVRPGCDPEAVLEEARQQFSAAGSRRRRRGGRGGENRSAAGDISPAAAEGEAEADDRLPPTPLASPADIVTVEVPARRRLSRGGEGPNGGEPRPGGAPESEPAIAEALGMEAPEEAGDEQNSDPRRRRRRSSATV